jgi:hypothetical protein
MYCIDPYLSEAGFTCAFSSRAANLDWKYVFTVFGGGLKTLYIHCIWIRFRTIQVFCIYIVFRKWARYTVYTLYSGRSGLYISNLHVGPQSGEMKKNDPTTTTSTTNGGEVRIPTTAPLDILLAQRSPPCAARSSAHPSTRVRHGAHGASSCASGRSRVSRAPRENWGDFWQMCGKCVK